MDKAKSANPRRINDRARAVNAVALRRDGVPLREIADRLGYHDASTVHRAIVRILDRTEAEVTNEYRILMTERYENLYRRCIQGLQGTNSSSESQLITSAPGVLDSLVRLHCLDHKSAMEDARGPDQDIDEIDREIAVLAAALTGHARAVAASQKLPAPSTPALDGFIERVASVGSENA